MTSGTRLGGTRLGGTGLGGTGLGGTGLGGDNQRVIQRSLRRGKGDTMRFKRGVVAPGRWSGERRNSAMSHNIVEAASSQVKERLHRHTNLVGEPFDLAKQCHQMIGADRSSGVIERSFVIVDDETLATE